jgi:hypothetical protein
MQDKVKNLSDEQQQLLGWHQILILPPMIILRKADMDLVKVLISTIRKFNILLSLFFIFISFYEVRSLELFYKLFLIDPGKREATQLCPFVRSGKMHREFSKYLKSDGIGIDYSKLTNFNTRQVMPKKYD